MNTEIDCETTTNFHAPSDLREQFQEWLDSYEPDRLQEIDIRPVSALLDSLADCGDVLPADYCDQLEILKGSTYAQAVEDVLRFCGQHTAKKVRETKEEAKTRWDSVVGMVSSPHEHGFPVFRSPTGFPLVSMHLWEDGNGGYRASFGQPILAQNEWLDEQVLRAERNDIEYVDGKSGEIHTRDHVGTVVIDAGGEVDG